ncbi:MAG: RDD family protein [Verrucomicrobiae bacterium]|nr:RDD family protein [Verrucomicrobiae bacterium]MCP5539194.1 RDD family protein [Akkermansiaceae bacterium]MCP5549845.1 RDD family protein [Akkermansiaceae bacterium]
MHFFIAIQGKKEGPLAEYRVLDYLREGRIDGDTLAWRQDLPGWLPLRDLPQFADSVERLENPPPPPADEADNLGAWPETGATPPARESEPTAPGPGLSDTSPPPIPAAGDETPFPVGVRARPLIRFWARNFDYMIVTVTALWFFEMPKIPPNPVPGKLFPMPQDYLSAEELALIDNYQRVVPLLILAWTVLEGLLLHLWGTTPGKVLLGIRVRGASGATPPLRSAVLRSFFVWTVGFGMGIPILCPVAMTLSFFVLAGTGTTLWDRKLELRVSHAPLGAARFLLAVAAFFLLMALTILKFQ